MTVEINGKEYDSREVRKIFKECRTAVREHEKEERKIVLANRILGAVEAMVHTVGIMAEVDVPDEPDS